MSERKSADILCLRQGGKEFIRKKKKPQFLKRKSGDDRQAKFNSPALIYIAVTG